MEILNFLIQIKALKFIKLFIKLLTYLPEVAASRTVFEVLGLEGQVLGLGLGRRQQLFASFKSYISLKLFLEIFSFWWQ